MIFARWGRAKLFHILAETTTLCGREPPAKGMQTQASSPPAGGICDKCNRSIYGETKTESLTKKLERKVFDDISNCQLTDGCEQQFKFHHSRQWRFDFAWPRYKIAIDINGGTYNRGKHSRGPAQRNDYEKWSEASILGWMVLLVDSKDVSKRIHIDRIQRAIEARTAQWR